MCGRQGETSVGVSGGWGEQDEAPVQAWDHSGVGLDGPYWV